MKNRRKMPYFFEAEGQGMGWIIFANYRTSQVYVSKDQAIRMSAAFIGLGITEKDWLRLKKQIRASELPDQLGPVEGMINFLQAQNSLVIRKFANFIEHLRREYLRGEEWRGEDFDASDDADDDDEEGEN